MTIIIDDDGVMHKVLTMDEVEKIKAEIAQESQAETLKLHWSVAMGLNKAIDIIDKYRGDTDVFDKQRGN